MGVIKTALSIASDPTLWFVASCLTMPPVMEYFRDPSANMVPKLVGYVTDPALIAGVTALTIAVLAAGLWRGLSFIDQKLAMWYLLNGAIIHITMDGLTGGYHFLDLMNVHYITLDRRFLEDEAVSWLITQMELWVMAPLCLITYYCIVNKRPARYFMEVLVSTLQLMGAIFFFGDEAINIWFRSAHHKTPHIPNIPVDQALDFNFHSLLYFWFGYGANLLWVVIPVIFIYRAISKGSELISKGQLSKDSVVSSKKRN